MTLLAHIGAVRVLRVLASALYFKTTGFDLLLPRRPAGSGDRPHALATLANNRLQGLHFPPKSSFGK